MAEPTASVLVVIPTYNERDNLEPLLSRLHAAVPAAHVLVVDDASPDGTGELADKLAAVDARVRVLHRAGKAGLGAAYLAGFAEALRDGYQVVVEMDADGSHAPEDLPALLAALDDADLVIGSRYVPGGRVVNWPTHRQWLSRGGNLYSRLALGVPIRDITGGYRAFRRQVLEELDRGRRRLPGLLLPGRHGLAGRAGRLPGARGPDHLHRARAGELEDEPGHRRRGAVAGHPLGGGPAAEPGRAPGRLGAHLSRWADATEPGRPSDPAPCSPCVRRCLRGAPRGAPAAR